MSRDVIAARNRALPSPVELLQMVATFGIVTLAWTFFRAPNIGTAFDWLGRMLPLAPAKGMALSAIFADVTTRTAPAMILLLFAVEWIARRAPHGLARLPRSKALRWALYCAIIGTIFFLSPSQGNEFIYFQF